MIESSRNEPPVGPMNLCLRVSAKGYCAWQVCAPRSARSKECALGDAHSGGPLDNVDYQRFVNRNMRSCSISTVGHCDDNAGGECFLSSLKREDIVHQSYRTRYEARAGSIQLHRAVS